jgi:uncharacterized protein YaiL (DUF2058 family)
MAGRQNRALERELDRDRDYLDEAMEAEAERVETDAQWESLLEQEEIDTAEWMDYDEKSTGSR